MALYFSLTYNSIGLAGPAINQFEVKDLEVEVGKWEFQSQNAHAFSLPDRKFVSSDSEGFEYDDNSVSKQRHAFEIEVGLTPNLRSRLGIEYEKERLDGDEISHHQRDSFDELELEELAVEMVYVLRPPTDDQLGLGLLFEFQYAQNAEESDSLVVNYIVEAKIDAWSMVLNPGLVKHFGGAGSDHRVDFTYGLQILRDVSVHTSLGLEGYGTIDRLGSTGSPGENSILFQDHDQHRLGPVVYFRYGTAKLDQEEVLTLGIGCFAGLNGNTAGTTLKWSLEYEF